MNRKFIKDFSVIFAAQLLFGMFFVFQTATAEPCTLDIDCSNPGDICDLSAGVNNGVCKPGSNAGECTLDSDCSGTNQYCDLSAGINNGVCKTKSPSGGGGGGCTLDSDCSGTNQYCDLSAGINNGVCKTKSPSGGGGGGDGSGGGGGVTFECPGGTTKTSGGVCVPNTPFTGGIAGSKPDVTLMDVIMQIVKWLLLFAGAIAVIALIIGGYWYVTSAGNEEQAEKGRKAIANALIGLVVIILSFTIITVVTNFLTKTS